MLSSDPADQSFLEGFLTSNLEAPAVFRLDLAGRGVATATYREGPTSGLFDFRQVTYAFLSPEPVPEPSTVLLVATGLIGAGVQRSRRRKP